MAPQTSDSNSSKPRRDYSIPEWLIFIFMALPMFALAAAVPLEIERQNTPRQGKPGEVLSDLVVTQRYSHTNPNARPDTATITVTNRGEGPARRVDLGLAFDKKLKNVSLKSADGENWNCSKPMRRWGRRSSVRDEFGAGCSSEAALQPGQSLTVTYDLTWPDKDNKQDSYVLAAMADPMNRIAESNRENNISRQNIR